MIVTPPSLLEIEDSAFEMCWALKRVTLNEGIMMLGRGDSLPENFGGIFQDSGVEDVTLPGLLREMSPNTFSGCKSLRAIWVGEGCTVDVRKYVDASVRVLQK